MENDTGNNPNDDFGITNSPPRLNRSDSILDIHTTVDFEEGDLPESESETTQSKQALADESFVTLPEPSKWERDEESLAEKCMFHIISSILRNIIIHELISISLNTAFVDSLPVDEQAKVTTEVLKRAENAIFAKAINAIRPIEIKKICPERQKLYANETSSIEREKSPLISLANIEKPNDDLLQITVLSSEQERSVEIKSSTRSQRNKTPVRSIKERLGKKLNEDMKSRSRTPQRKIVSESKADTRPRSSRSRDRGEKRRDNNRDRKYRSPKSNDNRPSSNARRSDSQKTADKSYRERERRRNSSENRELKDGKENKKNARDRDEKDSQSNKIDEKAPRDTDRDRELQKARVRARIREEERTKAQLGNNHSFNFLV